MTYDDRYQLWPQITLVFLMVFLLGSFFGIRAAWLLCAPDWGSFELHLHAVKPALIQLMFGKREMWERYWQWHVEAQSEFALVLHIIVPVFFAAVIALWISYASLYVDGGRSTTRHISGPQRYANKAAKQHAQLQFANERRKSGVVNTQQVLLLHPDIGISQRLEQGNVLVFGQQGSGKGVVLKPMIHALITRGDHVVIYDEKREYVSLFFSPKTILINPVDARSARWDIAADAATPERAKHIATQFIIDSSDDPVWANGARLILSGCFLILMRTREQKWGWPELHATINLPEAELHDLLVKYYPEAARLIVKDSKTTQSFLITLTTQLDWIATLARAWPNDSKAATFSVSQWLRNKNASRVLIIANDPRYATIAGPVCTALLTLVTSHILSLIDSDKRRIWFALDELGNLPRCDALHRWLSLGRSKGARTLAGVQNVTQLRTIYGDKPAETMLSMFSSVVALRLGASGESAHIAAKTFGKRIVERLVLTHSAQGQSSTTYQRNSESLVRTDEIVHLPHADRTGVEGFLTIGGWDAVYHVRWPHIPLATIAHPMEDAMWLRAVDKNKNTASVKPTSLRGRRR